MEPSQVVEDVIPKATALTPEELPEEIKPFKMAKKKRSTPEHVQPKPTLSKHIPEFEEKDLEPKKVEVIEIQREKPDEKESVFVRGKLKKASIVKRPIEEPKLETVELVSHDDEGLPVDELVSA